LDVDYVAFAQVFALLGEPFPGDDGVPIGCTERRAISAVPLAFSSDAEIRDGPALWCRAQLDGLAKPPLDDCLVDHGLVPFQYKVVDIITLGALGTETVPE